MEIASGIRKFSPDWLSGCNEFGWVSPNHQTGRTHMFRHNFLLLLENFGSLEVMQYPFPMSSFEEFCYIAVPGSLCSFSSFAALNTSSYSCIFYIYLHALMTTTGSWYLETNLCTGGHSPCEKQGLRDSQDERQPVHFQPKFLHCDCKVLVYSSRKPPTNRQFVECWGRQLNSSSLLV
ncbi:hypothetical protein CY35_02G034300 [Sphagnum magellanicum]|nr:hypothetical protein CY35_02G034300 [Sphagnum magellanicum]